MILLLDDTSNEVLASFTDSGLLRETKCLFVLENVRFRLLPAAFVCKKGGVTVKALVKNNGHTPPIAASIVWISSDNFWGHILASPHNRSCKSSVAVPVAPVEYSYTTSALDLLNQIDKARRSAFGASGKSMHQIRDLRSLGLWERSRAQFPNMRKRLHSLSPSEHFEEILSWRSCPPMMACAIFIAAATLRPSFLSIESPSTLIPSLVSNEYL